MINPQTLADNAIWVALVGIIALVVAWLWDEIDAFRVWRFGEKLPRLIRVGLSSHTLGQIGFGSGGFNHYRLIVNEHGEPAFVRLGRNGITNSDGNPPPLVSLDIYNSGTADVFVSEISVGLIIEAFNDLPNEASLPVFKIETKIEIGEMTFRLEAGHPSSTFIFNETPLYFRLRFGEKINFVRNGKMRTKEIETSPSRRQIIVGPNDGSIRQ